MGQNGYDYEADGQPCGPVCMQRDSAAGRELNFGRHACDPQDPADVSSPTLEMNELAQHATMLEERYWETAGRAFVNNEEARFTEDEDRRLKYIAKPWYVWFSAGMAAVFLFFLQYYIYLHDEAWRALCGPLVGFLRLGLMLLGGYCAFTAWPWRKLRAQAPQEEARLDAARGSFDDRFSKR
jgi:hypothetical protein